MNNQQLIEHCHDILSDAHMQEEWAVEMAKVTLAALNQAVSQRYKFPDGWKLVPIEPTEDMIVDGFESEPDETFSEAKVWEEYDAMSGCQQAAHRAKLCWQAMLAAAPEVN